MQMGLNAAFLPELTASTFAANIAAFCLIHTWFQAGCYRSPTCHESPTCGTKLAAVLLDDNRVAAFLALLADAESVATPFRFCHRYAAQRQASLLRLLQRPIQILNQVLHMLDANRQPEHVLRHPCLLQLLGIQLPVRGRCGVRRQ